MFVNGVLFNSEVWQGLNTADITMLDTVDHKVMNVICAGHAKTASEFYYLETGTIPLKYLIASRRILYLKNILSRSDEELIKRVYTAQRDNPTQGDFVELVRKDLEDIDELFDEEAICSQDNSLFKKCLKKKIKQVAFRDLKEIQSSHSKVKNITYDNFIIQPYITSSIFTNEMTEILFNMRSCMTKTFKSNFSSFYKENMKCSLKCSDPNALDSQSHLLQCSLVKTN